MGRIKLLDARAASTCARATHNKYDETIEAAPWTAPDYLQARFDLGIAVEAQVFDSILQRVHGAVDVRPSEREGFKEHEAATVAALRSGAPAVIGGRLPNDFAGRRVGKPDLLIRAANTTDGKPGYVPADVKSHGASTAGRGPLRWSAWSAPSPAAAIATSGRRTDYVRREADGLQLAHYWRMLNRAGFAAEGDPLGAIVGPDLIDEEPYPLTWFDLDRPVIRTYSRSHGYARRSLLERYNHEFDFRRQVAAVALQRKGAADDPEPLVVPIRTAECEDCRWRDVCMPLLDGTANAAVGRLDNREWRALGGLGIRTVEDLATLDADAIAADAQPDDSTLAELLDRYVTETTHRTQPRKRLAEAVRIADMVMRGQEVERTDTGPAADLPIADVEIDMDIEWDVRGQVYLWGFLRDDGTGEPQYRAISCFDELDDASEALLAAEAWQWLKAQVDAVEAAGHSVQVFHYSHPEVSRWRRIVERAAASGLPTLDEFDDFVALHFLDLNKVTKAHLRGVNGLGLKRVATVGAGFAWRDGDPGGAQSQAWHRTAVDDPDPAEREAAQRRLTDYNADDVAATHAVRRWIRSWS